MDHTDKFYFSKEELAVTPSRKSIDAITELSYRQEAAIFIQDIGDRLKVTQLCIDTAIVYMHRFYVYHSFTELDGKSVSIAALVLAAKELDQPRKLEHIIKVAHICLHKDAKPLDIRSEAYADKLFVVVALESLLLQTIGFTTTIEHPHIYVLKVCQLVKASKDLAQTSYFMATISLRMTTMCIQYKPTVVACVCINLACKWCHWKIEPCSEGEEWYSYVDKSVTSELLESLTQEFITILGRCAKSFKTDFIPSKEIPRALTGDSSSNYHSSGTEISVIEKDASSPGPSTSTSLLALSMQSENKPVKLGNVTKLPAPCSQSPPSKKVPARVSSHSISNDVYRERKENERLEKKPAFPLSEVSEQPVLSKPQHAFNGHENVHKHRPNSLESTSKEKWMSNKPEQSTFSIMVKIPKDLICLPG